MITLLKRTNTLSGWCEAGRGEVQWSEELVAGEHVGCEILGMRGSSGATSCSVADLGKQACMREGT